MASDLQKLLMFSVVWLVVGTVWILPIYSEVINTKFGVEVSEALDNVGNTLGETGLAGPTTAAPAVSDGMKARLILSCEYSQGWS